MTPQFKTSIYIQIQLNAMIALMYFLKVYSLPECRLSLLVIAYDKIGSGLDRRMKNRIRIEKEKDNENNFKEKGQIEIGENR